jgi:hypothetical protein
VSKLLVSMSDVIHGEWTLCIGTWVALTVYSRLTRFLPNLEARPQILIWHVSDSILYVLASPLMFPYSLAETVKISFL